MNNVARTYIGLTTEDGFLVLQGGAKIDALELLNRAELAEALSIALTIKYNGYVCTQWEDSHIEISGNHLPAKFGPTKHWTMLDKLSPAEAVEVIKEVADDPSARSQILAALSNGRGDQTLFEDSDGEVSTLSYLQEIGYVGDVAERDSRYFIDVYQRRGKFYKLVASREFPNLNVVKQLVGLLNNKQDKNITLAS